MSDKYEKLAEHLLSLEGEVWQATFKEIERVLGSRLPPSARKHQAWWSNQERGQSQAWVLHNWRTAKLDLKSERVVFYRSKASQDGNSLAPVSVSPAPLNFDQAKAGLAQHYGVDPSQIEIIVKA
jgi:hypothetical protein